ncbi:MAG: hypothetical protein P4L82_12025 [Ancalomicrobiaceae bacterium]|nr:hypothetical protein [Ancalomicrobiaceae bacterium]
MTTRPTAEDYARAIVMACRFTGNGPMQMALGAGRSRARVVAFAALKTAFPQAVFEHIARRVGFASAPSGKSAGMIAATALCGARLAQWWRDEWVGEIVGVLVGEDTGARAA